MAQKFKFDEKEYDVKNLSDQAKSVITSLNFADTQLKELRNMHALFQCAKNSYVESIKQEILSSKVCLKFEDD